MFETIDSTRPRGLAWAPSGALILALVLAAAAPRGAQAQARSAADGSLGRLTTELWGCELATGVEVVLGGGGPTVVRAGAEDRACVTASIQRSLAPRNTPVRTRLLIERVDGIVEVASEILQGQAAPSVGSATDRLETELWGCELARREAVVFVGAGPMTVQASVRDRACVTAAAERSLDSRTFLVRTRLVIRRVDGVVEVATSRGEPSVVERRWDGTGRALLLIAPAFLLGSGLMGLAASLEEHPLCIMGCSSVSDSGRNTVSFAIGSAILGAAAIALFAWGADLVSRRSPVQLAAGPGDVGLGLEASF